MFHNTPCILSSASSKKWCVVILQYIPHYEENVENVILIPPCIGASIGIYSYPVVSNKINAYLQPTKKLKLAQKMIVKEISPLPTLPNLLPIITKNNTIDLELKSYFSKERYVNIHSIFGIIQSNRIRFFKVVTLENDDSCDDVFIGSVVSNDTRIILSTSHDHCSISRLPCLPITFNFIISTRGNTDIIGNNSMDIISPFSNFNSILDGLLQKNTTNPPCSLMILNEDEDSTTNYLSYAAQILGMRYLPINGLASFYYHSSRNSNYTGSLLDKLQGIKCAIELAKESIPCLLHLQNFHQEVDNDDDVYRFLCTIRQELYSFDQDCKPSVQIVVSAPCTIPSLSIPCITLNETPNLDYIKYVWNSDSNKITNEEIELYLLDETIGGIQYLKKKFMKLLEKDDSVTIHQFFKFEGNNSLNTNNSLNSNTASSNIPQVSWDDIGGLNEIKNEIWNDITLPMILLSNNECNVQKSRHRHGLILYGPPGSGKTLVAKAIATTCKLPFINIKGPELLGSYVGESESNIRRVFSQAKQEKGAIIFFDEMDSIAPNTESITSSSQNAIMNRIVSTLILELDKCNNDQDCFIFVIGATNRPDLLHTSLLRPGRFDRRIYLGCFNDTENITFILKACMRKFKFENNLDVDTIIQQMLPFVLKKKYTGADLANVTKIGLQKAIRRVCVSIQDESSSFDDLDLVMDLYEEKGMLGPMVRLQDLIDAVGEVVPSVRDEDLKHYESLRDAYSSSN